MMFKRLKPISLDEAYFRIRQKIVTLVDRAFAEKRYQLTDSGHSFHNRKIAHYIETFSSWKDLQLERRFFQSFEDRENTRRFIAEHYGEETKKILDRAGMIIGERFSLLGHESVSYGSPIRWNFDPFSEKESPVRFWTKIDFLDFESYGDHKVIWELNRHQYLLTLGKAYMATSDETYVRAWIDQVDHWMDSNHPKTGINWASSLEIALRSISWIWCLLFFSESDNIGEEFRTRYLSFLFLNGLHIESNLSSYFSPNTHLTGEALGLFYLGLFFQETKEGKRWLKRGQEILIDQLDRQILPDGVYFEQTSYYHRYTTDIYLHFYILLLRNSMPVPHSLTCRLQQLLDFLAMSRKPDGKTPLFGDDDGGRLLFLDDNEYDDFRSCLATGAAIYERPDYKWLSEGFGEETFWLLGPGAHDRFDSLDVEEPELRSAAFHSGGYYIMRSGWAGDAGYLMVDCGPHGRGTCGHSHADLLSIQVSLSGKDLLIDPGTFTYTGSKGLRDYFRGSPAHNTISVDNASQSKPAGPFSWSSIATPLKQTWIPQKEFDFFSGESLTYHFLEKPVLHRRDILFLKGSSLWVMMDGISSEKERDVSIHFHFASNEVELLGNRFIASDHAERYGVLSLFSPSPPSLSVIDDWRSPGYSIRKDSRTGVCSFADTMSCSVITVIAPWHGSDEWACDFNGSIAVLRGSRNGPEETHEIIINEEGRLIEDRGQIDTDFHWIWKQPHGKEDLERYICVRGTKLALEGLFRITLEEKTDWLIVERAGHEVCVDLPVGTRYSCYPDDPVSLIINGEKIS
jgi:hypothetical protein